MNVNMRIAFAILLVVLGGLFLIVSQRYFVSETKVPRNPRLADEPFLRENIGEIKHGELRTIYFRDFELRELGLELDLTNIPHLADLELEDLKLGCPVKDCFLSIDNPRFDSAYQANWLNSDDLVLGVDLDGIAKAYPVRILNRHEVVNDFIGDVPILISYCPLCNSAMAFIRPQVDKLTLEFGVSGRVYKTNLVLYDRFSASYWSQFGGIVIVGPLLGQVAPLTRLQVDVLPWNIWKGSHPDTLVLKRSTKDWELGGKPSRDPTDSETFFRDYDEDPYRWYKASDYEFRLTRAHTR